MTTSLFCIQDFVGEVLKKCPSSMSEADVFGWTPLHYASNLGDLEVVKLFLKNDSCVAYLRTNDGMSALHIAAKKGHLKIVRLLITECPDACELLDNKGWTALHVAVESRKVNVVKILLQTLAFQDLINDQDKDGNTPFHLAAVQEDFKILAMMADYQIVEKGVVNKAGMTAFDIIQSKKQRVRVREMVSFL